MKTGERKREARREQKMQPLNGIDRKKGCEQRGKEGAEEGEYKEEEGVEVKQGKQRQQRLGLGLRPQSCTHKNGNFPFLRLSITLLFALLPLCHQ